ncbi:very short patch repair endonuclease [Bradyrhizobium oropedii]|uniref:very short patch repair endonuclease n=1 Tax=Bradyrhizobium oropedii TaxID=1571201 RepID=UPI00237A0E9C|nr:very short patch repair endonuclease [Bradyrhizobium oropedii]
MAGAATGRPKDSYPSLRSWTMAQIRSRNTKPEIAVRKAAHALGLRFRIHDANLAGTPDLVFPRWKTVLFVHGCFWHLHHCERARLPKTNADYWTEKLQRNARRDKAARRLLKRSGWRSAIIWECQVKDAAKLDRILQRLFDLAGANPRRRSR